MNCLKNSNYFYLRLLVRFFLLRVDFFFLRLCFVLRFLFFLLRLVLFPPACDTGACTLGVAARFRNFIKLNLLTRSFYLALIVLVASSHVILSLTEVLWAKISDTI